MRPSLSDSVYNSGVQVLETKAVDVWSEFWQDRDPNKDGNTHMQPDVSAGHYFKGFSRRTCQSPKFYGELDEKRPNEVADKRIDFYNYLNSDRINKMLKDLGVKSTANSIRERRIISLGIPKIVDTIIARNMGFLHISKAGLEKKIDSAICEMSLAELNSIGKNNASEYFEDIILEEEFLSPGFSLKMPYRERKEITAKINSITKGYPALPDFEE